MSDLIKQLRLMNIGLSHEAADRIEELEARHTALVNELKSLRDATYTSAVSLRTQIDRLLDKNGKGEGK
jgi:hypothetical protein